MNFTNGRKFFGIKSASLFDILKFILVFAGLVWMMLRGTEQLGYNWQWYRVFKYIFYIEEGRLLAGPIINGLIVTFQIAGISLFLASMIGLMTALLRLSNAPVARILARGYLEPVSYTHLTLPTILLV